MSDEDCSGRADPLQTIDAFVQSSFRTGRRSTLIRRLRVRNVLAGTTVRVVCRGGRRRGCRRSRRNLVIVRNTRALDLRRPLRLRRLQSRAVVEVALLRPDSVGEVTRMGFRSRCIPRISDRCVMPNGRRVRCP